MATKTSRLQGSKLHFLGRSASPGVLSRPLHHDSRGFAAVRPAYSVPVPNCVTRKTRESGPSLTLPMTLSSLELMAK
uniref:Uncharacterized protein n=1 Tax=Physcomitrium patens TaxID=3218 RepID=A0A2K1KBV8_PHYPA|nr:hypothetical protein PHYPA_010445 [Physcomitrium patens]